MTAVTASSLRTERRGVAWLTLSRAEAIDTLALLALISIGILGFRNAYGGYDYLLAGVVGAVLGVALSHIVQRVRLPLLAIAGVAALLFVVLGGVFAQVGIASALPTVSAMRAAVMAAVHGWKQLLTTGRPVGTEAHLLVLPYLLGLVAGVAGHAAAQRTKQVMLPALPAAGVVALSILFGADHPVDAFLQGGVFMGLALAWATVRYHRAMSGTVTIRRQRPWQRIAAATGVLTVSVAGAMVVGPHLPGANAHERVVLRTVPPFDVNAFPSPLAGFRVFTKPADPTVSLYDKQLLTTTGLDDGSLVRIAAMDNYDGLVWGVANSAAGASSFAGFQRIGTTIPGEVAGRTKTASITIASAYRLPWLPDLANASGFRFDGPAGRAIDNGLRFNVATTTGVIPSGLPAGLRYTVSYVAAPALSDEQLIAATPFGSPTIATDSLAPMVAFADAHGGAAGSPMARVATLAAYLKNNGRYADKSDSRVDVLAGHSLGRLVAFLQSSQIVGDGEQYAAAMALLANAVGVPARVVLAGEVHNGAVFGRDVHADVELHLAGYGWVIFPDSKYMSDRPPSPQPKKIPPPQVAQVIPPPLSTSGPATDEADNQTTSVSRKVPPTPKHHQLIRVPGAVGALVRDVAVPVLLLVAIAAALIGGKALRRRHRRQHGHPSARAAACWREMLDLGRDLGLRPDLRATRREQGSHAEGTGLVGAAGLAAQVDAAVFGSADPDHHASAHVWELAAEVRRGAIAGLPWWRRLWVHVNPASLWVARASGAQMARARVLHHATRLIPRGAPSR